MENYDCISEQGINFPFTNLQNSLQLFSKSFTRAALSYFSHQDHQNHQRVRWELGKDSWWFESQVSSSWWNKQVPRSIESTRKEDTWNCQVQNAQLLCSIKASHFKGWVGYECEWIWNLLRKTPPQIWIQMLGVLRGEVLPN